MIHIIPNSNVLITESGILFPNELDKETKVYGLDKNAKLHSIQPKNILHVQTNYCFTLFYYKGEIDIQLGTNIWGTNGLISSELMKFESVCDMSSLEKYEIEEVNLSGFPIDSFFLNNKPISPNICDTIQINQDISYFFGLLTNMFYHNDGCIYIKTAKTNGPILKKWVSKILVNNFGEYVEVNFSNNRIYDIIKIENQTITDIIVDFIQKHGLFPKIFRTLSFELFDSYCTGILHSRSTIRAQEEPFSFIIDDYKARKLILLYLQLKQVQFRLNLYTKSFPLRIHVNFKDPNESDSRSFKELYSFFPSFENKATSFECKEERWNPLCNSILIEPKHLK